MRRRDFITVLGGRWRYTAARSTAAKSYEELWRSNPGAEWRGNAKGRTPGVPNKATAALKDMILGALHAAGGAGGGMAYLQKQAHANPAAFVSLLGKVLPTTIANCWFSRRLAARGARSRLPGVAGASDLTLPGTMRSMQCCSPAQLAARCARKRGEVTAWN
jgi:hypothetical protein